MKRTEDPFFARHFGGGTYFDFRAGGGKLVSYEQHFVIRNRSGDLGSWKGFRVVLGAVSGFA